ncbi:MAG: prepilin-type N-terminal cleavage/methylation domain-containing protein [Deltaproteobacteria bacterium]|nr:prepilin-type N-terminal cleavage/methylation domain-containing protein [Deltaproteobacteria bacterium]
MMNTSAFSLKRQGGFTLVELLVALLMGSVILTALLSFFRFQTISMRIENARRAAQVTVRGALNFIVRDLEHIGRDPHLSLFTAAAPALQEAEDDSIHYLANLSSDWADNDDTDTWENVAFQYNSSTQAIEVVQGGTTYPLTDDGENQKSYVPSGGLSFTYFDKDGNIVAPGGNATARASIRRINVSVAVRGVVPAGHPEPEVTLSQDVFLRNVSS